LRQLARPSRAFGFAKFLSPFPKRLKCRGRAGVGMQFLQLAGVDVNVLVGQFLLAEISPVRILSVLK
jgi:hypothetical protein